MNKRNSDSTFIWEAAVAQYFYDFGKRSLSDCQRFISVWIAFNAWMKGRFGTKLTDKTLITSIKNDDFVNQTFDHLKQSSLSFAEALGSFSDCEIMNSKTSAIYKYDGTFGSLMETLYTLRNNTFHGADMSWGKNSAQHDLAAEIIHKLLERLMNPKAI